MTCTLCHPPLSGQPATPTLCAAHFRAELALDRARITEHAAQQTRLGEPLPFEYPHSTTKGAA